MAIEWDNFSRRLPHRKVALVVENREYWVVRGMLVDYSPVFSKMLYGDFVESVNDKVPLPDKKAEDILEMLRCIIPISGHLKEVNSDNVVMLYTLADEYEIAFLENRCAQFLERYRFNHINVKQVFVDDVKRGLKKIVRVCLPMFARCEIGEIRQALRELPAEVRCAVLYQRMYGGENYSSEYAIEELEIVDL